MATVGEIGEVAGVVDTDIVEVAIRQRDLLHRVDLTHFVRYQIDAYQFRAVRNRGSQERSGSVDYPQCVCLVDDYGLDTDEMIRGGLRFTVPTIPFNVRIGLDFCIRRLNDHRVQIAVRPAREIDEQPSVIGSADSGQLEVAVSIHGFSM